MINLTELMDQIDNNFDTKELEQVKVKPSWIETINSICLKEGISSDDVFQHLVSVEDEQDFSDGELTELQLHEFIKLWVNYGMQKRYK